MIIFWVILLDQLTKTLVLRLGINHACNIGFAFGILQGFLNGLIAFLVLLGVIYIFTKEAKSVVWLGLTLVIGGGLSNIIDRLIRGCVVDFIDLKVWPAFNLADAAISVGVAVLILSLLKTLKNPDV